jgi:hypothetical protein
MTGQQVGEGVTVTQWTPPSGWLGPSTQGVAPAPLSALGLACLGLLAAAGIIFVGVTSGSSSADFLTGNGLPFLLFTEVQFALWAILAVPLWRTVRHLAHFVKGYRAQAFVSAALFWS